VAKRVAVRVILAFGVIILAAAEWACAPRLDEQQVRTRLVDQLQLKDAQLGVRSISRDALPVASIDYGGAAANIRFRYQDGVWVIEAVERDGRWEPADRAVPVLARELTAKAHARQIAEVMPRYARTLKLLVGWSTLLTADCGSGLPTSRAALLTLHATWHRTLFVSRGGEFTGEFHDADLFLRDAWWKPLRVTFSAARVDVQSSGADGRMDTPDDVRLAYTRLHIRAGINACTAHYTMPATAAEALGRSDAPPAWNCADLLVALKRSEQLDLVENR
jgi:hypothetical protein